VQAAGHLVGIVVRRVLELTAGVELGHDDLGRRDAFLGVDAGRDAAAIILDRDRAVGVQRDRMRSQWPASASSIALSDHLEHHVVEARAVVGVADIHSGPFADRVEALQHLDGIGAVAFSVGDVAMKQLRSVGVRGGTGAKFMKFTEFHGIRAPDRGAQGESGEAADDGGAFSG
jgi:hypothetical protein